MSVNNVAASAGQFRFGIEELLLADARVVFENVFSTRHVGRIMDFMLFECRDFLVGSTDPSFTEHRVRSVLEMSIFNGWSNYRTGEEAKCVELELGWDLKRLIVSSSFYVQASPDAAKALANDATAYVPLPDRIQKMVSQLHAQSDGVAVRHEPKTGRVHIMVFIQAQETKRILDDVLRFNLSNLKDLPRTPLNADLAPQALSTGDVDGFLADERADRATTATKQPLRMPGEQPRKAGDIIVKKDQTIGDEEKIVVKSEQVHEEEVAVRDATGDDPLTAKAKAEAEARVIGALKPGSPEAKAALAAAKNSASGGHGVSNEDVLVVADHKAAAKDLSLTSGPEALKNSVADLRMGTNAEDVSPEMKQKTAAALAASKKKTADLVLGKDSVSSTRADLVVGQGDESSADETAEVEQNMQVLLDTVKADILPLCANLSDAQFQEAFRAMSEKLRENYTQTLHHLMRVKNIQTISKVKLLKDQISLLSTRVDELTAEKEELLRAGQGKHLNSTEAEIIKLKASAASGSPKTAAEKEEYRFKAEVQKFEEAIIKGEIPAGAQAWAHNFMQAMLKDRALLNERMHTVDAHLRKTEHEFKTKEVAAKEMIRIKEEQLKQKDFALKQTKESLQTAYASLETARKNATEQNSDKMEFINRTNTAERLLAVAKESNERSTKRADELQRKWQSEFDSRSELQTQLSLHKKELDELKRKFGDPTTAPKVGPDPATLMKDRDRALKVIDELKRQNGELQAKLSSAISNTQKTQVGGDSAKRVNSHAEAEMKHKVDQANKLTKVLKDELDKTKKRFDELKREETKLRVEVSRLTEQLKIAGKAPHGAASKTAAPVAKSNVKPGTGTSKK